MNSDFEMHVAGGDHRIAIFASGAGTNAENCIRYFRTHASIYVALIVTNKPTAGVIEVAERYGIPYMIQETWDDEGAELLLSRLAQHRISFILLAGFLSLVPNELIRKFTGRIINIHPALLPAFGGKGMYGKRVHAAVYAAGVGESGITIHEVDEEYDHGKILFQAKVAIDGQDTPASIEEKVRALEYAHLPAVVEKLLLTGRV